jgi:hypothetical protein
VITRSRPDEPLTLRAVHVGTGERITTHSLTDLEYLLSYPERRTGTTALNRGLDGRPDKEGK